MSVEIRIPTLLRTHTGGQSTVEATGTTLGEVFADVGSRHPGLAAQLRDGEGNLHKFMNVYINDDDVRYLGKLEAPVKEGDKIAILPAVAGG